MCIRDSSYTLHITQTVITIALLYIPVLVAAVVQVKLAGKHKRCLLYTSRCV